ncbi:Cysteine-rich secretory protein family protein [anaerobic digester metagenome]
MKRKLHHLGTLAVGAMLGAALCGGASAAVAGVTATPSTNPVYLDGQQITLEVYNINGNNYMKLRDIGKVMGFNVYWDDGVQIDSDTAYTGEAPESDAASGSTAENIQSTTTAVEDTPVDVEFARNQVVSLTNDLRRENGLSALTVDENLMQAAQIRAEEMAATTTYSHTRPDGTKYSTVTGCRYVAENINRIAQLYLDQRSKSLAEATVDSWAYSDGHLANMLSTKANAIGVGIAKGVNDNGKDAWYCVQEFLYKGYTITQVYTLK